MKTRPKMKDRYRRYPYLTDISGIKSAIGEAKGFGFPKQPRLNKEYLPTESDPALTEEWFINTIKNKLANHPDNSLEHPYYGEKVFNELLVGFVRGDDPLFNEYKRIIGPHHFTPEEIMKWQADNNGVPAPKAEDLSVVSFIMPITRNTIDDNAAKMDWVSERWAQTRLIGEIFSQTFVREIAIYLILLRHIIDYA